MVLEVADEDGGDRLPAFRFAFLTQQDQALLHVQILRAQGESAPSAAGRLQMQSKKQRIEGGVIAGGGGAVDDLG